MKFSLRQLEVFAAVARLENVSAAADELGMSQSAASTALGELERRSGRPLFDRAGKRLRLNELGRQLLPQSLDLLERAREIDAVLSGQSGPGPLKLGATVTIANYIVPAVIERYRALYPQAAITLEVRNTEAIAAQVSAFELDVALIEGEYSDPNLVIDEWIEDELTLFCSPRHPLAHKPVWTIEDVLAQKWAVREKGSGTRQTLDRAMREHWSRWQIGMELQHIEAIMSIVEAGAMIGCASRRAAAEAFNNGRLVEVKAPDLNLRRRLYIVMHRQKYVTAGIRAFLDLIRSIQAPPPPAE